MFYSIKKHATHFLSMNGFANLIGRILILAAAYSISGGLGLLLAIPPGFASPIFPPSGIAFGGLLLLGYRAWPGIWVGSFVINAVVSLISAQVPQWPMLLLTATTIASGSTLQAIAGVFLVQRFGGFPNQLACEKDVGNFLFLGGVVSCVVSATVGVTSLWVAGIVNSSQYLVSWRTWWVGDTLGVLIFAPLVIVWFSAPREKWQSRRKVVTIPLGLAFTFVIFSYISLKTSINREDQLKFRQKTNAITVAVQQSLSNYLELIHSNQALYLASSEFELNEFQTFTRTILSRQSGIQAISWNPVIKDSQRAEFEKKYQKTLFSSFSISEREMGGKPVSAGVRAQYFPVLFIEPFENNQNVLGFDVGSEIERATALNRAADTGTPTATGRLTLVQSSNDHFGVLIFLPVYGRGLPGTTVEERRSNLRGFFVAVLRVDDVVNAAIRPLDREGININIYDGLVPADQHLLYADNGALPTKLKDMAPWEKNLITIADRKFSICFSPTVSYLAAKKNEGIWILMTTGLLFSGLLGSFFLMLSGRDGFIHELIERRTEQLNLINHHLAQNLKFVELLKTVSIYSNQFNETPALIKRCLEAICSNLDWDLGHVYLPAKESESELFSSEIWYFENPERYKVNRQGKPSSPISAGVGLAGRVFSTGRPEWVSDVTQDANFYHLGIVSNIGVSSGVAFPILIESKVVGVIECFSSVKMTLDDELMKVLENIGIQMGQAIQRYNAESELRFSHRRNQLTLNTTFDAFVSMNAQGLITDWNPQSERIFGWLRAEVLGLPLAETIIPERFRQLHKQGLSNFLKSGVGPLLNSRRRMTAISKTQNEFEVELAISPIKDGDDYFFSAFIRDVSQQKKIEDRYRNLFESALDIISIKDLDGNFISINPAFETITGWACKDWLGKSYKELLHPDDIEKTRRSHEEIRKGIIPPRMEARFRTRDGSYRTMESVRKPLIEDGRIIGTMSLSRDVTERKRSEEALLMAKEHLEKEVAKRTLELDELNQELKHSNTELEHFAAVASHDLKEPLRTISTQVSFLSEVLGEQLDPSAKEYMGFILDATKRMKQLVEDLLEYSKIGSAKIQSQPVDGQGVLKTVLEALQVSIEESQCEIKADPLPTFFGDEILIGLVFQNLISNSIKYRSSAPLKITVKCQREENCWRFSVQDNGIGFDMTYATCVFEIFRRLHTKDAYPGTGIGLAVCKKIIERHGGRIWVESKKQMGSTFFFTIPERNAIPSLNSMAFLLVGDSKGEHIFTVKMLKDSGASVVDFAKDAEEGIKKAENGLYDVILMNVDAPDQSGIDVMRELRKREYEKPIFALSATAENKNSLLAEGFTDCLTLPLERSATVGILAKFRKNNADRSEVDLPKRPVSLG